MPNILAIETSLPAASIALQLSDGSLVCESFESHRQQNQLLFPPLQKLLASLPNNEKLDLILVGTGPGSYSGSRIAIAAAQGVAVAHQCPVVGQSSFLATQSWLSGSPCCAVGDARRGAYFIATIGARQLPSEPRLLERDAFDQEIATSSATLFTLEPTMQLSDGPPLTLEAPTAAQHISAWNTLSEENQQIQLNTPAAPAYLRAPFITKAKPGHPLLRGKVKGQ